QFASSTVTLPARTQFSLPTITTPQGLQAEGIAYNVTQDGSGHSIINQVLITGFGADGPLTIGSPTQIGDPLSNTATTIYNLQSSFRQDFGSGATSYLSTQDIAWDQFNGSSYNIEFKIFNFDINGNPASSPAVVTIPVIASGANINSLPSWQFRAGAGAYEL